MIRGFLLIALVIGATVAKPNPQSSDIDKAADALDQLERVSAGGYDNTAANVDQSVLDELFGGGSSNEINNGYKPPPPENQVGFPKLYSLFPNPPTVAGPQNWKYVQDSAKA